LADCKIEMENELARGSMDTSWSLETLEAMAKEHDGKAIRIVCTTPQICVLWECCKGHRWDKRPELVLRGDWCPFCERDKQRKLKNPKMVKTVTVQQIFNGEKFELFAFDMNNLAMGWCKSHPKEDILNSDFSERIQKLLPKAGNYLSYFFASNNFAHMKQKLPTSFQNRWYIENLQKNSVTGECMDIDSTLTGRISSILEIYRDQITHFHLGSGDADLHYVVDVAHLHKIPVTIIAFDNDSLNTNLKNMSEAVELLNY
jgi:hypothetical protein